MNLIPQNEVDSAALKYAQEYVDYDEDETFTEIDLIDYAQFDFKAGVSFAESKLKDLAIEFAEYLVGEGWIQAEKYNTFRNVYHSDIDENVRLTTTELFEIFIKERNGV